MHKNTQKYQNSSSTTTTKNCLTNNVGTEKRLPKIMSAKGGPGKAGEKGGTGGNNYIWTTKKVPIFVFSLFIQAKTLEYRALPQPGLVSSLFIQMVFVEHCAHPSTGLIYSCGQQPSRKSQGR